MADTAIHNSTNEIFVGKVFRLCKVNTDILHAKAKVQTLNIIKVEI